MTTMLERAARAVNDAEARWSLEPTGTRSEMITRAVLMAVREPDDGVWEAGNEALSMNGLDSVEGDDSTVSFTAMIDAILADGEGR